MTILWFIIRRLARYEEGEDGRGRYLFVGPGEHKSNIIQRVPTRGIPTVNPLLYDFFDASHFTAHQAYFDTVRMLRGFGEDIPYYAIGDPACGLILFEDDTHIETTFDIFSFSAVHSA